MNHIPTDFPLLAQKEKPSSLFSHLPSTSTVSNKCNSIRSLLTISEVDQLKLRGPKHQCVVDPGKCLLLVM